MHNAKGQRDDADDIAVTFGGSRPLMFGANPMFCFPTATAAAVGPSPLKLGVSRALFFSALRLG